ncbi:MAG TPA: hypothetical protein VF265_06435 [Nevskiaceae bacterium]
MNGMKITTAACAVLLGCVMASVAAGQGVHAISVDMSSPNAGASCPLVASSTQLHFDGRALGFHPRRVEVLVNGVPAQASQVRNAWPRVTLNGGLVAGRNTVELLAWPANGPASTRTIVVRVGDSVRSSEGIAVACSGPDNLSTAVEPQPVVTQTPAAVQYGVPVTTVYPAAPAYTSGWYGYPYAGGWYGAPYYYGGWAPGLSVGIGLGYGWGGGWHGGWRHGWRGGYGHWRGGYGGWHGGGHWHGR